RSNILLSIYYQIYKTTLSRAFCMGFVCARLKIVDFDSSRLVADRRQKSFFLGNPVGPCGAPDCHPDPGYCTPPVVDDNPEIFPNVKSAGRNHTSITPHAHPQGHKCGDHDKKESKGFHFFHSSIIFMKSPNR